MSSAVQALQKHTTNSNFDKAVSRVPVKAGGKVFNLPPQQVLSTGNHNEVVYRNITPSNGSISFGNTFDFKLIREPMLLNRVYLKLALPANNTTQDDKYCNAFAMIDTVSVLVNGGQELVKIEGRQMAIRARMMQTEQEFKQTKNIWGHFRTASATNGDITTTDKLADQTSAVTYFVPLLGILLDDAKILMSALSSDPIIRVTLKASALCDESGQSETITAASSGLEVEYLSLNFSTVKKLEAEYKKAPQHSRVYQSVMTQLANYTASGTSSFLLSGLQGNYAAHLFCAITQTAATDYASWENVYDPASHNAFTSFTLLAADGTQLSHRRAMVPADNRLQAKSVVADGNREFESGYDLQNAMLISHAQNISYALKSGADVGSRWYNGNEKIEISSGTNSIPVIFSFKTVVVQVSPDGTIAKSD